ncbi:MAG: AAA family ATPase, partial [Propionibacteriaceae bacterium]|nr:AAA family ATPase [Propionibacteriaceae bacterium]
DSAVRRNLAVAGQAELAAAIPPAATIHRLLGIKPWGAVDHGAEHPLAADVIVVDEVSMLSLRHMGLLLDAAPAAARLILAGDPDQLASVEAGAVLADLVAALTAQTSASQNNSSTAQSRTAQTGANHNHTALNAKGQATTGRAGAEEATSAVGQTGDNCARPMPTQDAVSGPKAAAEPGRQGPAFVRLQHNFRFAGAIGDLAEAIRNGAADRVLALLAASPDGVDFIEADVAVAGAAALDGLREAVVATGRATVQAVAAGDWAGALAAADRHRVLCGHRRGPFGVSRWHKTVESWLAEALPGYGRGGPWYPGLPVQVTHNDEVIGVFNGDTGVIVPSAGQTRVVLATANGLRLIGPAELDGLEGLHATTIHKAQGSQFDAVSVIVPPPEAALLTRELLYTAVTRAQRHVRLIGTAESVACAVNRQALRASGLAGRLTAASGPPTIESLRRNASGAQQSGVWAAASVLSQPE